MNSHHLSLRDFLLALAVVAVWGTNFVVIRLALDELPALLLAALRFAFAFLPVAFFLPRPRVRWAYLAAYGLLIGVGQFGILFIAMEHDITPGLASVIVQMQVFFTIALFGWRSGEKLRGFQWIALLLGVAGIGVIIANAGGTTTPLGVALTLAAALAWTGGNLAAKEADPENMLAFVVWSSLFAVPPLLLLALVFDGPQAIVSGISHASAGAWAAVLWQAIGNSLFGYAAWGWLLQRHPAATVTPMALLVPLFGMGASIVLLGEDFPSWKALAAALIVGGLAIIVLTPRWTGRKTAR
jgi:O-acetylserine/cysteine efflux transporter